MVQMGKKNFKASGNRKDKEAALRAECSRQGTAPAIAKATSLENIPFRKLVTGRIILKMIGRSVKLASRMIDEAVSCTNNQ
jgi:hypothetical protein